MSGCYGLPNGDLRFDGQQERTHNIKAAEAKAANKMNPEVFS